jgi:hypothetical protein
VHEAQLPAFLWTEAVFTANYLVNISPTRANSGVTPEQAYSGTIPSIDHLRIFGCLAHLHISKEHRKKMDSKSHKCLFLGYDRESKMYRLYDPEKKKILLNRDVIFDETKVGYQYLVQGLIEQEYIFPLASQLTKDQLHSPQLETHPEFETNMDVDSYPDCGALQPISQPNLLQNLGHFQTSFASTDTTPATSPLSFPPPIEPRPGLAVRRYPTRRREPSNRLKDLWTLMTEILSELLTFKDAV